MTLEIGIVARVLVLILAAASAVAQEEAATERRHTEPIADCPCFDPTKLTELPGSKWDLCIDTGTTVQIAKWFGRQGAEGKPGFNVLASQKSSRTAGGSCRLVWRYREDGELKQDYSRVLDLTPARAEICHEMLRAWLDARGGCESEVAEE
jgi:hypothetical protein